MQEAIVYRDSLREALRIIGKYQTERRADNREYESNFHPCRAAECVVCGIDDVNAARRKSSLGYVKCGSVYAYIVKGRHGQRTGNRYAIFEIENANRIASYRYESFDHLWQARFRINDRISSCVV